MIDTYLLSVLSVETNLVNKTSMFSAPPTGNGLQREIKLKNLVSQTEFKFIVNSVAKASFTNCYCF